MFSTLRTLFSPAAREAEIQRHLEMLRERVPVPVLWLLGKTQSGKTSIIRYLTGAVDAQIGRGFRPCTRHSRRYQFPSEEVPLVSFLDTRGLEEPGYDPAEDVAAFDKEAHLVLVTVKALDHAQEGTLRALRAIRESRPSRPVLLALTCLHEAYPQQQHPSPLPADLLRSVEEQERRFRDSIDDVVLIDLTPAEEGFEDPNYGGPQLKHKILDLLPAAYRQTLLSLDEVTGELRDLYERLALPHIVAYSVLAASAGAFPIPWLDLLILPGIQTRMVQQIGAVYGQSFNVKRFLELASGLGLGLIVRQAAREVTKLIPFAGSVASGALAGASTFALGKAVCFYYAKVREGHTPSTEELRQYYREQLSLAERHWANNGLARGNGELPQQGAKSHENNEGKKVPEQPATSTS
jgi:uncharacterized protein (DUF697 family)/predicted GTPase